ncbi:Sodium/glucose cotransporter [Symmachiella dynata]|uniref:sodium:solute symporter family transporter n=1 Tax=Symmachiella dynata TaxID=2527995 RepID=UPI00118859B9|nr:sodium/solute symporter [Symmachiella dynata]QDT49351.1 Sodium/glucose cotransporter [Symmachiella dynata]
MPIFAAETSLPNGGLTTLDLVVIGLYLAGMLCMGFVIAMRQKSTDDFFVGGRNLPAWAVGVSILASLLSTITYLGMPGEMFRTGIGFLTRQLSIPVVLVVVWFLWIPFFMKLRLTSAYEYLEVRFNYAVRATAAVICMLLIFGWMAVVVLTASRAMGEIANLQLDQYFGESAAVVDTQIATSDLDLHVIIAAVGMFSVLYTTLGGIRAVVWTDVIQFFILIAGAFVAMGVVASMTDSGLSDWFQYSQEYKHEQVEWFSWDIGNRSTVFSIAIGMCFWIICTHGSNQVALQRYFAVKDIRAARRSYLVSALASFGLSLVLAAVGMSIMYFIAQHHLPAEVGLTSPEMTTVRTAQDNMFPQFIRYYIPSGLRGMVVAALFAAAMSTIDSGSNSVSTILTVDFFRRLYPEGRTIASELKLARTVTATMGIIVVVCTIGLYHASKGTDIISLCQKGFNMFLGPLGAIFVLAMFSRRATAATVLPAVVVGELVGICSSYSNELFGREFSTHMVVPASWAATIVSSLVLSTLLRTLANDEQQQWMWRPVVRGAGDHPVGEDG